MIIALRTDKPEAELYLYDGVRLIDDIRWQAHRQLSNTLLAKIDTLLKNNQVEPTDITGIIAFAGPGSFTGLRIGVAVANSIAYAWQVPVVASLGDDWQRQGVRQLSKTSLGTYAVPMYGSEAHITAPRK